MSVNELIEKLNQCPTDVSILAALLQTEGEECEQLAVAAMDCMTREVGVEVYLRGLVEMSNVCIHNCYYCGIRRDADVARYTVTEQQIIDATKECSNLGYGSMVLQSGELPTDGYVDFVCRVVERMKKETRSDVQPDGVGITLSLGVLSKPQYQRLFDAGAHRFLLRIESSNEALFKKIHPPSQKLEERYVAIAHLAEIGFQTGTGVMIGLPTQTIQMLANDIVMFQQLDIDMVGMGPFLPSANTPMANWPIATPLERLQLGLNMIAVTRLACRDINIASTTALEALHPNGRNLGLAYGANVAMPNFSPFDKRSSYKLYDNKPVLNENIDAIAIIEKTGRPVARYQKGDPLHYFSRQGLKATD